MKTLSALLAAALISGMLHVRAQEAAPLLGPTQDIGTAQILETPSLFPPNGSPTPAPGPQATAAETSPSPTPAAAPAAGKKGTAEQLRQAIRIRELKTQVLEDPEVQGERAKANQAKTEEGRRVLMRNYYTLLYTKMEKLDPSLTEPLEQQLAANLRRFEQHSIRPSILIEAVTPLPGSCSADHVAPQATPDASPKPTHQKQKRNSTFIN
ncbi:MAG: hypothetical protein WCH57_02805 [Verrucomicrobiota bacterium]